MYSDHELAVYSQHIMAIQLVKSLPILITKLAT